MVANYGAREQNDQENNKPPLIIKKRKGKGSLTSFSQSRNSLLVVELPCAHQLDSRPYCPPIYI
jgi:hypothetical protein